MFTVQTVNIPGVDLVHVHIFIFFPPTPSLFFCLLILFPFKKDLSPYCLLSFIFLALCDLGISFKRNCVILKLVG